MTHIVLTESYRYASTSVVALGYAMFGREHQVASARKRDAEVAPAAAAPT